MSVSTSYSPNVIKSLLLWRQAAVFSHIIQSYLFHLSCLLHILCSSLHESRVASEGHKLAGRSHALAGHKSKVLASGRGVAGGLTVCQGSGICPGKVIIRTQRQNWTFCDCEMMRNRRWDRCCCICIHFQVLVASITKLKYPFKSSHISLFIIIYLNQRHITLIE